MESQSKLLDLYQLLLNELMFTFNVKTTHALAIKGGLMVAIFLWAVFKRRAIALWVYKFFTKRMAQAHIKSPFHFRLRMNAAILKPASYLMLYFIFITLTSFLNFGPYGPFITKVTGSIYWILMAFLALRVLKGFEKLIKDESQKNKKNSELEFFLFKITGYIIYPLTLYAVFAGWGVDLFPLIAGLGIFGMAFALGAQDFLKNFFGSVTIIMDKTFKRDDHIKTKELEGIVEELGFRSTTIRQPDKTLVTVPNAKLADGPIVNLTKMQCRRIDLVLPLDYKTPSKSLLKITDKIRTFIAQHPGFVHDTKKASTIVHISALGDAGVEIMCQFFTKSTKFAEYMALKEESILKFMEIIEKEGAELASTVYALPAQKS